MFGTEKLRSFGLTRCKWWYCVGYVNLVEGDEKRACRLDMFNGEYENVMAAERQECRLVRRVAS